MVFSSPRHLMVAGGCIIVMEIVYKMDFSLIGFLVCAAILGIGMMQSSFFLSLFSGWGRVRSRYVLPSLDPASRVRLYWVCCCCGEGWGSSFPICSCTAVSAYSIALLIESVK